MYRCYVCGCWSDRFKVERQWVGEFWGAPCYEEWAVCFCCGGGVEVACGSGGGDNGRKFDEKCVYKAGIWALTDDENINERRAGE